MEQHVPARLVSSIYRLAPPSDYVSKEEQERRLKVVLRRLVAQWGVETVVNMIRKHDVPKEDENLKAWLVLSVYAEETKSHRQSSW